MSLPVFLYPYMPQARVSIFRRAVTVCAVWLNAVRLRKKRRVEVREIQRCLMNALGAWDQLVNENPPKVEHAIRSLHAVVANCAYLLPASDRVTCVQGDRTTTCESVFRTQQEIARLREERKQPK